MEFPLEETSRNWYDDDPNHWLVINGLQYSGKDLQQAVARYLEKEMRKGTSSPHASPYATGKRGGQAGLSPSR